MQFDLLISYTFSLTSYLSAFTILSTYRTFGYVLRHDGLKVDSGVIMWWKFVTLAEVFLTFSPSSANMDFLKSNMFATVAEGWCWRRERLCKMDTGGGVQRGDVKNGFQSTETRSSKGLIYPLSSGSMWSTSSHTTMPTTGFSICRGYQAPLFEKCWRHCALSAQRRLPLI